MYIRIYIYIRIRRPLRAFPTKEVCLPDAGSNRNAGGYNKP